MIPEAGPGIRAIEIASPFTFRSCIVGKEATDTARQPLTIQSTEPRATPLVTFVAEAAAPIIVAGREAFGWLVQVEVELVSGSARLAVRRGDEIVQRALELTTGTTKADVLLSAIVENDHLVFERDATASMVEIRVLGFTCYRLEEDSETLVPPKWDAFEITSGWSNIYGERLEDLPSYVRDLRFRTLTRPRLMRWVDGLEVFVAPLEQISRAVYLSGRYEPCTVAVLRRVLHEGSTFVDVGANIGLFTMLAARWVGSGRVIAFEPSRREHERLRRHIEHNGLANTLIVRCALGSRHGKATLHVADSAHAGLNTLEDHFMYDTVDEAYMEDVDIQSFDEFVNAERLMKIDVIKVDIEGGEPAFVEGARETLRRDRPALLLEIASSGSVNGLTAEQIQVSLFLRSLGYVFVAIDGDNGTLRRVDGFDTTAENFLAAPPELVLELDRQIPVIGWSHPSTASPPSETHSPSQRPYLSIILTGRNDFGAAFSDRLFRALDFNHRELARRHIPHEFVFVEWNPVSGNPSLGEILADRFPELVPHVLTSYVIDARYHDAYSLNPKLQFQEYIAKNIGVRRCSGSFILTTNSDIHLGRGVLDLIAERSLETGVVYCARRITLKDGMDRGGMDWTVLEDARNYDCLDAIEPPDDANAPGDFLLLDRESYHALKGFNEVYRVANVGIDRNFCVKARSAGLTLRSLDSPVYKLGRGDERSRSNHREKAHDAQTRNREWNRTVVYQNDPEWGLWGAPSRCVRPGVHCLDFTWTAVPPAVALHRVVLSVSHASNPAPSAVPIHRTAVEPASAPYPITITHRTLAANDTLMPDTNEVFDDALALTINRARIDFLSTLELPLDGKRVLDAGCGVGHHTPFYTSHGCRVVGIDGRRENIAAMATLYPDVEGHVGDVQSFDLGSLGDFDVVHCLGLLYHLESPVTALRRLAAVCRGQLVIETIVCDAEQPVMVLVDETSHANQALAGVGCRPSPSFVAMALDRIGFQYVYGTSSPPRHPDFEFEWKNNMDVARNGFNLRCVFVASRTPLSASHLVPLIQTK